MTKPKRKNRLQVPPDLNKGARMPRLYMPHHFAMQDNSSSYTHMTADEHLDSLRNDHREDTVKTVTKWSDFDIAQFKLAHRISAVNAMYEQYVASWLPYLTDAELDEALERAIAENERLAKIVEGE